jgi:hypothetical protein
MFVSWLEQGVFDALSRGYLDTVLLEIYENTCDDNHGSENARDFQGTQNADSGNPGDNIESRRGASSKKLQEVFSFAVSYPPNSGPYFNLSRSACAQNGIGIGLSKENIKKNTSEVLRLLVQMASKLQPLPERKIVSIKLLYTDKTPAGYEPPLFQAASESSMGQWFENRPLRISPGKVLTPYHEMSINIRTALKIRENQEKNKVESDTSTDSTMSSVGESESTRPPQHIMTPHERRNCTAKSSTEHIDIGASCGNSCRGVKKAQVAISKSSKSDVEIKVKSNDSERKVADAANDVRRLSLQTNAKSAKPNASTHVARAGFNGANADSAPKRLSKESKSGLRLRIREQPRTCLIPNDETPQTDGAQAEQKNSAARYRNSIIGTKMTSEKTGKDPPATNNDLNPQATPRETPTIRASAKRRKVSEVANPIEQVPKRSRRSIRARELADRTGGTENVSTCF